MHNRDDLKVLEIAALKTKEFFASLLTSPVHMCAQLPDLAAGTI